MATIETINIEWLIDPSGQIQAKSAQHLQSVRAIEDEYAKLGTVVTTNEQKTAAAADAAILKLREQKAAYESVGVASRQAFQVTPGADERFRQAQRNAEAFNQKVAEQNSLNARNVTLMEEEVVLSSRLTRELEKQVALNRENQIAALRIPGVGIGPGQAGIGGAFNVARSARDLENANLLRNFNQAARSLEEGGGAAAQGLKSMAVAGEEAGKGLATATGRAAQLRAGLTSLTRLEGLPGVTRGLRLLGSDAASMAGGFILLEGAFLLAKYSSDQLQESLAKLKEAESGINAGLVGATANIDPAITRLRAAREEIIVRSNALEIVSDQEMSQLTGGFTGSIAALDSRLKLLQDRANRLAVIREQLGFGKVVSGATEAFEKIRPAAVQAGIEDVVNQSQSQLRERFFQLGDVEKFNAEVEHSVQLFGQMAKQIEAAKAEQKLFSQAEQAITALQQKRADNPLANMILEAGKELEHYTEQFQKLPGEVAKAAKEIAANLRSSTFREALSGALGGANLQFEIEKAKAGLPGSDLRAAQDKAEQDRLSLEKQISDARNAGDSERLRQLQFQFETSGKTDVAERLNRDFRQRQIDIAQSALGEAKPDDRRFVLDKIIELTNQTGTLTQEQADLRIRALEERFKIGAFEQDKSRVVIEVIDKTGGNIDSKIFQELGPQPGQL